MFIRRKWARMGSVLKLYVRISAVLLIAVVVLAFNLWSNERNRIFEMRTTLYKRIQDRIQRGKKLSENMTIYLEIGMNCF